MTVLPTNLPHAAQLLTLIVPWAMHETIEDLLLAYPEIVPGFSASTVDGHGGEARLASVAERVRGHARQMRFQLLVDEAGAREILGLLSSRFADSGIFYWLIPVTEAGRL